MKSRGLKRVGQWALLFVALSLNLISHAFGEELSCGQPLSEAWNRYQGGQLSDELSATLPSMSMHALARVQGSVGSLSEREERLKKFIFDNPPPLTHRMPFDRLQAILRAGSLQSPRVAVARGAATEVFTPPMENALFGGHSCVFLAMGPPHGRERYGDVILRFSQENLPSESWATLSSGWNFIKSHWPMIIGAQMEVTEVDRLAYAASTVKKNDWTEFFANMIIAFVRKVEKQMESETVIEELMALSPQEFWQKIDENRYGYLEVKVPNEILLTQVEGLEMPAERLVEACTWTESNNWKRLLGCQQ